MGFKAIAGVMLWSILHGTKGDIAVQLEIAGQALGALTIAYVPLTMKMCLYVCIIMQLLACALGPLGAGLQGVARGVLQTAALTYASEFLEDNKKLRAFRLFDFAVALGLISSPAPILLLAVCPIGSYVLPAIGIVLLLFILIGFQPIAESQKPENTPPRTGAILSTFFLQFTLITGFTLLELVPKVLLLSRSLLYDWALQDTSFLLTTALSCTIVAWALLGSVESQEREMALVCQAGAGVGWLFLCDYSPAGVPFTWLLLGYACVLLFSLPLTQVLIHTILSRALGPNAAVSNT